MTTVRISTADQHFTLLMKFGELCSKVKRRTEKFFSTICEIYFDFAPPQTMKSWHKRRSDFSTYRKPKKMSCNSFQNSWWWAREELLKNVSSSSGITLMQFNVYFLAYRACCITLCKSPRLIYYGWISENVRRERKPWNFGRWTSAALLFLWSFALRRLKLRDIIPHSFDQTFIGQQTDELQTIKVCFSAGWMACSIFCCVWPFEQLPWCFCVC